MLQVTYQYLTKIFFISMNGDAAGKVTDLKASIYLSFDFSKYQITLESFEITHTG